MNVHYFKRQQVTLPELLFIGCTNFIVKFIISLYDNDDKNIPLEELYLHKCNTNNKLNSKKTIGLQTNILDVSLFGKIW